MISIFKLLILLFLVATVDVFGQNHLSTIKSLYEKADFRNCARLSNAYVKQNISDAQKAESFKYLGICQYMLKNRTSAELAFRRAVRLNPNISISSSEVLDTSIINFFNENRNFELSQSKNSRQNPKQTTNTKSNRPTKANTNKTTLLIKSNVKGSVNINGILAGDTNQIIDADPGQTEIEVSSSGYRSRKFKINVLRNRENQFTVNLSRPTPKAQPSKASPSVATSPSSSSSQPTAKSSAKDVDLFGDESTDNQLAGRNLAQEFAIDQASGGAMVYPQVQTPMVQQQPGVIQAQPPIIYTQPPVYQPMPVYPQQPFYGPPYPQQPMVQQAPPADYGNVNDRYVPPPVSRRARTASAASSASSSQTKDVDPFVKVLPFGIPQFTRGSYVLGTLIGGGQVGALIYGFMMDKQAKDFETEARAAVKKIREQPGVDEALKIEQERKYLNAANATIADLAQQSQFGYIGFLVVWGVGVVEAFMHTPTTQYSSIQSLSDIELARASNYNTIYDYKLKVINNPVDKKLNYGLGIKIDF